MGCFRLWVPARRPCKCHSPCLRRRLRDSAADRLGALANDMSRLLISNAHPVLSAQHLHVTLLRHELNASRYAPMPIALLVRSADIFFQLPQPPVTSARISSLRALLPPPPQSRRYVDGVISSSTAHNSDGVLDSRAASAKTKRPPATSACSSPTVTMPKKPARTWSPSTRPVWLDTVSIYKTDG